MTQFHFSYLLSKCPVSKYRHSEGLGLQQMNGGRPISALNRLAFSVNPVLSPGEWTIIWRISVDCLLSPSLAQSPLDFRPSGHLAICFLHHDPGLLFPPPTWSHSSFLLTGYCFHSGTACPCECTTGVPGLYFFRNHAHIQLPAETRGLKNTIKNLLDSLATYNMYILLDMSSCMWQWITIEKTWISEVAHWIKTLATQPQWLVESL